MDQYIVIEMDNFDFDVDEYLNQNKMMVHEDFVVGMNVEEEEKVMLLVLFQSMVPMVEVVMVVELEVYLMLDYQHQNQMKHHLIQRL
jgi:hypothetical protein